MITEAILNLFSAGTVDPLHPLHPRDPAIRRLFGMGSRTKSGAVVDENTAMALPAVMRAVSIISNGLMKLPFYVFREEDEGRNWDKQHPSWGVIKRKPNSEICAGPFRQTLTAWAMTWGNAVAYIDRPNWPYGPVQMYPLLPDRTFPVRWKGGAASVNTDDEGTLMYATRINGEPRRFPAEDCLHIRGLGSSPYWGYNIIETLSEAFGGAMATAEHGHRLFGQGAQPTGFVKVPQGFRDEEALEQFLETLRTTTSGLGQSHKLALLEQGAEFQQFTMPSDAAQFLETKQFDVRILAMALGVKAHKLIDSANSSYKSLEQANQEHRDDDLMPWICRWREEYEDKLLTEDQKATESHSVDTDDELLEWMPFKERADGVSSLYNSGVVDKDEARRKMNYGPSKTSTAKRFRIPANIVFEGDSLAIANQPVIQEDDEQSDDADALAVVSRAYMSRIEKRLGHNARRKAAQGADVFIAWLDGLSTEAGPFPLQSQIDLLYSDTRAALNRCTLMSKDDTQLQTQVATVVTALLGENNNET